MSEELIKFTPGVRPAHIGPDELVYARNVGQTFWHSSFPAKAAGWLEGFEYRLAIHVTDDQLEAQCKARGWEAKKPLVTQAERDRLADAFKAFASPCTALEVREGLQDEKARAFIDTYEGAGQ